MRVVRVVLLVLALSALSAVSGRRIHKLQQALRAVESEEVEADVALPFDGDYWAAALKPEITKSLAAEAKKAQLSNTDVLNKFFAPENIQLAQQQGVSVQATVGTYTSSAALKSCNEGVCDDKWTAKSMDTPNTFRGGAGSVVLTCSVPTDLKTATCDISLTYGAYTFLTCSNVGGGANRKCSSPKAQRYSSGAGSWMSDDFITTTVAGLDVYLTGDALTLNFKWYGNDYNKKLWFTAIFVQTANWKSYKAVVSPAVPAPLPALTKALKATQLTTAEILKKFFTDANVQFAQQQQSTVQIKISQYTATALTRSCNVGVCDAYAPFPMDTPNQYRGGAGDVTLTCSVPADLKAASCDLTASYGAYTLLSCTNVGGGAAAKCTSPPKPQRYSSGAGSWMSNDIIATTTEAFDYRFTAEQLVIHWRYRGNDYNKKLWFTDFTFVAPFSGFAYYTAPAAPAEAPELVKSRAAKALNTQDLLKKFFNSDNIALAQMQGSTVPVRATIAAYKANAVTRTCDFGMCGAWSAFVLAQENAYRGGEGSVVLTCSVPADLTKASCDLTLSYGAYTLLSCPNVGSAKPTCSVPKPQRYSSGAGSWMSNDIITTTTEVAEVLFTNDQLVLHSRYRGNDYNKKLWFTDFTLVTTPFADFGFATKTNCLSKTTPEAIIAAAEAKKGLKTKIVLQKPALQDLIKSAPYATVEDAVAKIKGIGPVNVVYVSFMWNFQC